MENELYVVEKSVENGVASGEVNICEVEVIERDDVNRKRNRTPSDEGWNMVTKGHKIVRRSSSYVEEDTQVIVTCSNALPKQFALAKLLKSNDIVGVSRVKYIHQFKIIINFEKEADTDHFIRCKALRDLGWRSQKATEVGLSYGVIKNIDLDVSDEDIIKNLTCEGELLSAKRLNKRKHSGDTGWIKCETIRLAFKGSSLPAYIYLHGMKINVVPYVFPVTQCSRCWKFGHTRLLCPSKKVVCPKCTKNHENCEITSFVCVNCTGNHMALQKVCPVFKKEKRIRELMSEFNCTYRKALTIYVPPSPVPDRDAPPVTVPAVFASRVNENLQLPQKEIHMLPVCENTEKSSFKDVSRKQRKHNKQKFLTSQTVWQASTSSQQPMEFAESRDTEDTGNESQDSTKNRKKSRNIMKSSFVRWLVKIYKIIIGKESLEEKLHKVIDICKEWILPNIVRCFSADSLLKFFDND